MKAYKYKEFKVRFDEICMKYIKYALSISLM